MGVSKNSRRQDDEKRMPTIEDRVQSSLTAAAARGLAEKLKDYISQVPNREIRNLSRADLLDIAAATISAYASKRAELEMVEDLSLNQGASPFS